MPDAQHSSSFGATANLKTTGADATRRLTQQATRATTRKPPKTKPHKTPRHRATTRPRLTKRRSSAPKTHTMRNII